MEGCTLCPRQCGVDRAKQKGYCGMGKAVRIARADLHFWEEPCISGENGSGAVFFSGCHLRCIFCQNYEISACKKGKDISVGELAEIFLQLQKKGAENINLVTPTHFVPQIITALDIAKAKGLALPIVYNCGGYESVETIKMLEGYVDVYLPDFKYFNNRYAKEYSHAPDYFPVAVRAIAEMFAQTGPLRFDEKGRLRKGVLVRHLMLPGLLFDSKKILDYLSDTYGNQIQISLMRQYTPLAQVSKHPKLGRKLPDGHYDTLVDYADSLGLYNVYVQDEDSVGEEFIPPFEGEEESHE